MEKQATQEQNDEEIINANALKTFLASEAQMINAHANSVAKLAGTNVPEFCRIHLESIAATLVNCATSLGAFASSYRVPGHYQAIQPLTPMDFHDDSAAMLGEEEEAKLAKLFGIIEDEDVQS